MQPARELLGKFYDCVTCFVYLLTGEFFSVISVCLSMFGYVKGKHNFVLGFSFSGPLRFHHEAALGLLRGIEPYAHRKGE